MHLRSAEKVPEVLEAIEQRAEHDPAHRRLFIRGINYETKKEGLEKFFLQYGEIEDCTIVNEKGSNRSRGFGFVVFKVSLKNPIVSLLCFVADLHNSAKDMDAAYAALEEPLKDFDGRQIM